MTWINLTLRVVILALVKSLYLRSVRLMMRALACGITCSTPSKQQIACSLLGLRVCQLKYKLTQKLQWNLRTQTEIRRSKMAHHLVPYGKSKMKLSNWRAYITNSKPTMTTTPMMRLGSTTTRNHRSRKQPTNIMPFLPVWRLNSFETQLALNW